MGTQQFCLKWNNHSSNMLDVFGQLLTSEALVDVTLACDGLSLKAHKLVLSACSPFFQSLFLENPCTHPIIILHDLRYTDLRALIDFMYNGEVNVSQNQLTTLLKAAETLKVKGLGEFGSEQKQVAPLKVVQNTTLQVPLSANDSSLGEDSQTSNKREEERQPVNSSNISDINEPMQLPVEEDICVIGSEVCEKKPDIYSLNKQQNINVTHLNPTAVSEAQCNVERNAGVSGLTGEEVEFELEPCRLMEQSMTTENEKSMAGIKKNDDKDSLLDSDSDKGKELQGHNCFPHEASSSSQDVQCYSKGKTVCGEWCDDFQTSPATSLSQDICSIVMCKQTSISALPGPSTCQQWSGLSISEQIESQGDVLNSDAGRNRLTSVEYRSGLYKCLQCEKLFTTKNYVKKHMDLHKPYRRKYICVQCGRGFNWHHHLLRHQRTAHQQSHKKHFDKNQSTTMKF